MCEKYLTLPGDKSSVALFLGALEGLTNPPEQPWASGGEEQVWPRYTKRRQPQEAAYDVVALESLIFLHFTLCYTVLAIPS